LGIHVQVDMFTERRGGDIIWGIHGEYPYAGGNYDFRSMNENGNKETPLIIMYKFCFFINNVCINFVTYKFCYRINNVCINFVTV
jgi:hypothetical protein